MGAESILFLIILATCYKSSGNAGKFSWRSPEKAFLASVKHEGDRQGRTCVRKLSIIILAATAAMAASPAEAQDNRRPEARNSCSEQNSCSESRGRFLWFYVGQDEGQRRARRVTRRLALDD